MKKTQNESQIIKAYSNILLIIPKLFYGLSNHQAEKLCEIE